MIKIIAFIRRLPDLPREDFLRIWHDDHPPLVRELPGLRGYRQNHATDHPKGWPWDGAAELWFDDQAAVKAAFETEAADRLREHEKQFISEISWMLVDERPIWLEDGVDRHR
jgi:uncharacterized protein (TIGR02118 family)